MPPIQLRHSAFILLLGALVTLIAVRWMQSNAPNGQGLALFPPTYVDTTESSDPTGPLAETCSDDAECGSGFFCREGLCSEYLFDNSCQEDSDCQLVNSTHGYSCCWQGACDSTDASLENWIAVNKESFEIDRKEFCPSLDECGPAPLCPTNQADSELVAGCVEQVCQKIEPRR